MCLYCGFDNKRIKFVFCVLTRLFVLIFFYERFRDIFASYQYSYVWLTQKFFFSKVLLTGGSNPTSSITVTTTGQRGMDTNKTHGQMRLNNTETC